MANIKREELLKDKFHVSYLLFYLFGIVTFVPPNFFTTATDYWMYKFRDTESNASYKGENRTELQAEFTADYTIVTTASNFLFVILALSVVKKIQVLTRVLIGLIGIISVFFVTCVLAKVDTDSWQSEFLIFTLTSGCVMTFFSAIFTVTLSQLGSKFPPLYFSANIAGTSICGMLAAVAQIVALSLNQNSLLTGIIYFGSAIFFVLFTLIGVLISLKKSDFFKHYFNKKVEDKELKVTKEKVLNILSKVKFHLIGIFLTITPTIMIHPGVTSLVRSIDADNGNKWNDVFFVPTITFLLHAASDYCGKELAIYLKKPTNPIILLTASTIRIVFIPLILLCNVQPRHNLPVVFDQDYYYIIITIIFALSNGFLVNIYVTQINTIPSEDERPLAMFVVLLSILSMTLLPTFLTKVLIRIL